MKTLSQEINQLKTQKEFAWLITMLLMMASLAVFKNAIVFILEKLYEIIIQRAIER
jgi:hypothetical protein